jgi:sugar phosphate isomerase/epimerase
MTDSSSRRKFLQTSALGAAALLSLNHPPVAAAEKETSASPARRPYMKLSLAAYSFNRFLPNSWRGKPKPDAPMTLEDFIDFCAEQQIEGTELTGYYFPAEITADYLNHLKNKTFRLGLDISGTAIGNDFCSPDEKKLAFELERCKTWIDHAADMGAPVIRVFAGKVQSGDSEEAAIERCADTMNKALEYAATRGVALALENHGGITATPAQMLSIIDKVKPSPWFGVNFDSGNFRTDDPYRDLEKIAPLAINAQIKVKISRNGQAEPADMERIVGILKKANYRGYLALEYEEKEEPRVEIPKHLARLKELIHG